MDPINPINPSFANLGLNRPDSTDAINETRAARLLRFVDRGMLFGAESFSLNRPFEQLEKDQFASCVDILKPIASALMKYSDQPAAMKAEVNVNLKNGASLKLSQEEYKLDGKTRTFVVIRCGDAEMVSKNYSFYKIVNNIIKDAARNPNLYGEFDDIKKFSEMGELTSVEFRKLGVVCQETIGLIQNGKISLVGQALAHQRDVLVREKRELKEFLGSYFGLDHGFGLYTLLEKGYVSASEVKQMSQARREFLANHRFSNAIVNEELTMEGINKLSDEDIELFVSSTFDCFVFYKLRQAYNGK